MKTHVLRNLFAVWMLSGAIVLGAQTSSNVVAQSADANAPQIPLYGAETPGTSANEYVTPVPMPGGGNLIRNVSRPVLIPILPTPAKANGAAVVVVPGGAFIGLAIDLEGFRIAHILANHGIAAFVLKYRLVPTAADGHDIGAATANLSKGQERPDTMLERQYKPALEDGIAAVSFVRRQASSWSIDRKRVGMIGFSAGAITALNTARKAPASGHPDFVGYIYGPEEDVAVPVDAPPLFVALALDDQRFHSRGFPTVEAWERAKRPVEVHAYQKGGHGFGSGVAGTTTTLVMDEFLAWLEMNGFLKTAAASTTP
jgi:acetyl esterase/lipase